MKDSNIDTSKALAAYFNNIPAFCKPYGNGHINDTFLVVAERRYILQRMNTSIFTRPHELMENILGVTEHIRNKAIENGTDASRSTLVVVPTLAGDTYYRDGDNYFRMYEFCEGTVARDAAEGTEDFRSCGEAFGIFQCQLADFPAHKLHETIQNFHNTPWRYENLMNAVDKDSCGRLCEVIEEVEFVKARKEFLNTLEQAHSAGKLPLRVTHNDTKLNNILFDEKTGVPVCVIDLDTVMPGYSVNDFGDSIRFGANTAAEDETDLEKVALDLDLFRAYAEGFLKGCQKSLTPTETALLPVGAMMMTMECGIRFLTDYLEGDVYFKIHRPRHNLDRARNQFALVADMERKLDAMNKIIAEIMK